MKLIITGSIGLDDVKTPFGEVEKALGGSGVYASAAASFFEKPGFVGIMGTEMPAKHLELMKRFDLRGVEVKGETFRWKGFYEYDMNEAKTLETKLNSLADFNPILPDDYRKANFLFLGNTDTDIQLNIIDQMEGKPFIVLDTMNFWITSKREKLLRAIAKVNLVVMNEGEARQLFDTPNLIKAGKMLLELGPEYAVIKKGEHGALLFGYNRFFSAPGYPLEEVKDPTGAGDSFAGGLIGYLAKTDDISWENLRKAVIYGSTIASFCAEDFSLNYLNKINHREIEERYNVFTQIREF
ncbi:MAG: PfkB family carbohydrate kinase [Patescibacteria group bacterium]